MALTLVERIERLRLIAALKFQGRRPAVRQAEGSTVLIFCEGGIGDLVVYSGILSSITQKCDVTFTSTKPLIRNLLEMYFPDHEVLDRSGLQGRYFQTVVTDFNSVSNKILGWLLRLNPETKIGNHHYKGDGWDYLRYNRVMNIYDEPVSLHSSEHFYHGFEGIARALDIKVLKESFFPLPQEYMFEAQRYMVSLNSSKPIVVVQMDSSFNRTKNWSHYAQLLRLMEDRFFPVLVGNENERETIETIVAEAGIENYRITAGELSLMQTIGLINEALFYIGNDGGLGHVSASLGKPTLTLYKGSNIAFGKPIGKRVICLNDPGIDEVAYMISLYTNHMIQSLSNVA